MRKLYLIFLLFVSVMASAQEGRWSLKQESDLRPATFANRYKPSDFKIFQLDESAFRADIQNRGQQGVTLSVPSSEGRMVHYKVSESPVMEAGLAARYPEIKSYRGKGIEDPTSTIYFDLSPRGFHGMILSADRQTEYIDPVDPQNRLYVVFSRQRADQHGFVCSTPDTPSPANDMQLTETGMRGADDSKLRTYRLALACTGEYANYFLNGTETSDAQRKSKVLAAMVTLVVRSNGIYERDFGIHMNLVSNNDAIIYLNASTDPWTTEWNIKTQQTIDAVIGNANYDIGHLVHKESSAANNNGNAGCIGCVCKTWNGSTNANSFVGKGGGFTSHVTPEGDPFVVDYTTHEMGHQFGANHTFTFSNESGTASQFEPGSGSTIMGYAGITGSTDVQPHSDDYFHTRSIEQVTTYIKGTTGGSCAVVTNTGNTIPVVSTAASYTIPKSTPFALTATASDADAADILTYTWEQINAGTASTTMPSATATSGPVFRSRNNGTNPTRTFPILSSILDGTNGNTWEKLPSVARTLSFRVTVKDNHTGGGGNQTADASVVISSAAGPFAVTVPNTAVSWAGGSSQNITWSVAGTTASPVNCSNVKISLSTDGGQTFPNVLAASTPNDGSESLLIPNIATTTARIKEEAVGNIFFDISNTNFTITSGSSCAAPVGLSSTNISSNGAIVNWSAVSGASGYTVDYKLNSSSTWINAVSATTATSINLSGLNSSSVYDWRVATNCNATTSTFASAQFTTSAAVCDAPTGLTSSAITSGEATLAWAPVNGAASYAIDYKLSSASTWTNAATSTSSTSLNLTGLSASSTYDWRVRTNCSASNSAYTSAQFTTSAAVSCNAPGGLASSSVTSNSAIVSWSAVSGAASYAVDYKLSSSSTWISAATATTANSVSLNGLTASSVYDWRVATTCASGTSTYGTAQFTTTAPQSSCVSAYEPNETLAAAASITSGGTISAAIGANGDIDYYKILTTATGSLAVSLSNLPADFDLYVYNASGTQLGSSAAGSTTSESVSLSNLAAGTYYIKVIGYNGAFSTSVCYSLLATATPGSGTSCASSYDNSTNGTTSGAPVIPFNSNVTGLISPSGDIDLYKFVITTGGTITLTLATLPADYDLRLLNSAGTQLAISQKSGTSSESISYTAAAGTYYARVYGYSNANNASTCYTLKVQLGTASRGLTEIAVEKAEGLKVYPNPAINVLHVSALGLDKTVAFKKIRVIDTKGVAVMSQDMNKDIQTLDIGSLRSGVYILKVSNGIQSLVTKFVKE